MPDRFLKISEEERNSSSPVNKIFRIVDRWGIANNYVYCDEGYSLFYVFGTPDGLFEIGGYAGRFSDQFFQDGIKDGKSIKEIMDVEYV